MGSTCTPSTIRPASWGKSRSVINIAERQNALRDLRPQRHLQPQMLERMRRQQAAARRAADEALLDEERLDDFLDRIARLRQRGGDGLDADGTAAEIDCNTVQIAPVERIKPAPVDLEITERAIGDLDVDLGRSGDRRKIAHPA